jgi:regulator of protease activity HflC (stomatin/prohibitin superfamily)
MKKILAVLAMTFLMSGCTYVPPGYVGIVVHQLGGDKGVDQDVVGPGRQWLGWNDELYKFPTFTQTQVWTQDKTEGSPNDDSITFQASKGLNVNTDIGITYSLDPSKVGTIFQKYRSGIDEITHTVLRSMVRDALVLEASTRQIEDIYGPGKADLIDAVKRRVISETNDLGINIENIYWIGSLRLPPSIVESINRNAQAIQMTQQREQEVQQSRAEAEKRIEEARGDAESTLLRAHADAEAIAIKGKALANNPLVIEYEKVGKWDGGLPQVVGGSTPFINLTK